MLVQAKRADVSIIIQTPYNSKYAAVDYCVNMYGEEFNEFFCIDFLRKSPRCEVDFITKEFVSRMSSISLSFIEETDRGVHKCFITVENGKFYRKSYFNDTLLPALCSEKDIKPEDAIHLLHYYQLQGYKVSHGKVSQTEKIIAKF